MKVAVQVHGLKQFRKEIKAVDRSFGPALRRAHKAIGDMLATRTRSAAPARIPNPSRTLRGRGTQKAAFLDIVPVRGDEIAVFVGAKRRFGWYSAPRYRRSEGRQFRPWVGNQWDPGERDAVPYFIGDAINASVDDVIELYADQLEELAVEAFPDN